MKLIDESILLNFTLPKELEKIIERLTFYTSRYQDDEDMDIVDVAKYDCIVSELDVVSKQYLSAGKISKKQRDLLVEKYKVY